MSARSSLVVYSFMDTSSPAPVACTDCRSRHLKCDATTPSCSRCQSEGRQCRYVQSRRGYKGPRKRPGSPRLNPADNESMSRDQSKPSDTSALEQMRSGFLDPKANEMESSMIKLQMPQLFTPPTQTPSESIFDQEYLSKMFNDSTSPPGNFVFDNRSVPHGGENIEKRRELCSSTVNPGSTQAPSRHALNLYYQHFHDNHPILLPRRFLFGPLFNRFPDHLKKVMHLVGIHYDGQGAAQALCVAVGETLSIEHSWTGFRVQSLLLYAIVLHARDEQKQAREVLGSAIEMALELGMHRAGFAAAHSYGSPLMEESWRRTMWELYVVDTILSFHMHESCRLSSHDLDILLPCDDSMGSDTALVLPCLSILPYLRLSFVYTGLGANYIHSFRAPQPHAPLPRCANRHSQNVKPSTRHQRTESKPSTYSAPSSTSATPPTTVTLMASKPPTLDSTASSCISLPASAR